MQLSAIVLASLPALAFAQGTSGTTTQTSTTILTKTLTLSQVHTVTSTVSNNTAVSTSVGTTSFFSAPSGMVPTATASPSAKGPSNAAGTLDATKVALAGLAGMLAVAMM